MLYNALQSSALQPIAANLQWRTTCQSLWAAPMTHIAVTGHGDDGGDYDGGGGDDVQEGGGRGGGRGHLAILYGLLP